MFKGIHHELGPRYLPQIELKFQKISQVHGRNFATWLQNKVVDISARLTELNLASWTQPLWLSMFTYEKVFQCIFSEDLIKVDRDLFIWSHRKYSIFRDEQIEANLYIQFIVPDCILSDWRKVISNTITWLDFENKRRLDP